jgi:hypothetical protein
MGETNLGPGNGVVAGREARAEAWLQQRVAEVKALYKQSLSMRDEIAELEKYARYYRNQANQIELHAESKRMELIQVEARIEVLGREISHG